MEIEEVAEQNPIAGLRAVLADIPLDAQVVCMDGAGGLFHLAEVASVETAQGTLLVLTLRKVGHDPSADGWTGVDDLVNLVQEPGEYGS